ncbi:hypothetical protein IEQ34_000030 [Dendrobium chrysotoxum]|uniref:DUF4283 domain-containing protein n=1 Tax=Dendrobium chrysotoxum TaxID=161865 RepID=A0AAV7HN12_DENCH|nr:hypothetical protein IEQ34_000030 [Dendrobium chrysotoxum]
MGGSFVRRSGVLCPLQVEAKGVRGFSARFRWKQKEFVGSLPASGGSERSSKVLCLLQEEAKGGRAQGILDIVLKLVEYEGLSHLCFHYGFIGHKVESYPHKAKLQLDSHIKSTLPSFVMEVQNNDNPMFFYLCKVLAIIDYSDSRMEANRLHDLGFLNARMQYHSFLVALSGSFSLNIFPNLKTMTLCGLPYLWISKEDNLALVAPSKFSLVGKFLACRLPLDLIRMFFFNLKLVGDFSVTLLNPKNVLFKLVKDLDYCRVFSHQSYFMRNYYMKLTKWSPLFDVDMESPIIPILGHSSLDCHKLHPPFCPVTIKSVPPYIIGGVVVSRPIDFLAVTDAHNTFIFIHIMESPPFFKVLNVVDSKSLANKEASFT